MSYDTEGLGFSGHRGGQLHRDERAAGLDEEAEPSELDAPESDGLDDDELEDERMDAASPLAEDVLTVGQEAEEEGFAAGRDAADSDSEDDIDQAPDVVRSGGSDGPNMSQDDRRREFPTAKEANRAAKTGTDPRVTKRRGRKKIARA
jgi:hypothetical protein